MTYNLFLRDSIILNINFMSSAGVRINSAHSLTRGAFNVKIIFISLPPAYKGHTTLPYDSDTLIFTVIYIGTNRQWCTIAIFDNQKDRITYQSFDIHFNCRAHTRNYSTFAFKHIYLHRKSFCIDGYSIFTIGSQRRNDSKTIRIDFRTVAVHEFRSLCAWCFNQCKRIVTKPWSGS
ncbi:hypothetical protein HA46_19340 [Pantoea septica]|uniref:Uncharacterized protein n=1 Tax=Pantoea septica TaxID=472695 RepID=A0ABX3UM92_9GAMM|nr:hypothetical protein HA46_19340 [Pantoea septica]